MKTVLILITILLGTPIIAKELPNGISCSDLFWYESSGRVNALYLSDKQKCILATKFPEKTGGEFAGFLWVKIEGKYFSVSKVKLQSQFSNAEKAKKAFEIEILRQFQKWKSTQQTKEN